MEHRKFHINAGKNFIVRVADIWKRLPKEVV